MKTSTPPAHHYRVRLRGQLAAIGTDLLFDKIINCFKRHPRNLYDSPDFVLRDLDRFGCNLDLLVDTRCKQLLLQRLRYLNIPFHAFVILGNHFHLAVTTQNDVSISQLMRDIDWRITTSYNKLHKTSGTLWQGPFKHSVWESTAANVLRLIDYLHANPLRAGLCTEPDAYPWSSYSHYAGTCRRKALVVPLCRRRRWPRRQLRQSWYEQHFADGYRSGKLRSDPAMGRVGVVGSGQFVKALTRKLGDPMRLPAFVPGALKLERQGVIWGLKTLLHLLCKPLMDAWLVGQKRWKELTERLEPLVPVPEPPA